MTEYDPSAFSFLKGFNRWRMKWQRQIHTFAITTAFLLFLLLNLGILPSDKVSTSVIGLLIAYVLLDIADNTYKDQKLTLCGTQEESSEIIRAWLKNNGARKATIIDCSSHEILGLIKVLLEKNAQVTVYLQTLNNVKHMGSQRQVRFILEDLNTLYTDYNKYRHDGQLQIWFYDVAPSIQVVKIDDSLLEVGFFVWEHLFDPKTVTDDSLRQRIEGKFEKYPENNDPIRLWGHTKPRIVAYKHTPEYYTLSEFVDFQIQNFEIFNALNGDSEVIREMSPDAVVEKLSQLSHP